MSFIKQLLKSQDEAFISAARTQGPPLSVGPYDDITDDVVRASRDPGAPRRLKETARRYDEVLRNMPPALRMKRILGELMPGVFNRHGEIAARGLQQSGFSRIWLDVSDHEWGQMFSKILTWDRRGRRLTVGLENITTGLLRELVVTHLPRMQDEAAWAMEQIFEFCLEAPGVFHPMDTRILGAARLPGLRKPSQLKLGPDRLMGAGYAYPGQVILDGVTHDVVGKFLPNLTAEIKGGSGTIAGIQQKLNLETRASKGIIELDGALWEFGYDALEVRHLVVAPKGPHSSAAAKRIKKLQGDGFAIDLIEYSAKLDDEIYRMNSKVLMAAKRFMGE